MRPEKILSTILAHKDKLLNLDIISKELTNRGRTKEEIKIAIELAYCIAFFDSLLFKKPIVVGFSPKCNKDELFCFFASYCHPSMTGCDSEEYTVYVERLLERIKENKGRFVSFDEMGSLF